MKKYYQVVISFILGGIVFGLIGYARDVSSSEVTYSNTSSGLSSTNVKAAIDELNTKVNTRCP